MIRVFPALSELSSGLSAQSTLQPWLGTSAQSIEIRPLAGGGPDACDGVRVGNPVHRRFCLRADADPHDSRSLRTACSAAGGRCRPDGRQGGVGRGGRADARRARRRSPSGHTAAGVLPPRRRHRSPHGRRRHNLRHRLRSRHAGELERPLPVSRRRWPERVGAAAAGRVRRRRHTGARPRVRGCQHRHRATRDAGDSTPASCRTSRRASTSPTPRLDESRSCPNGSSPSTTARRRSVRISPDVPPAAVRRC